MRDANAHRKTVIWLGSDDGEDGGMNGYGFDVHTEDNMVAISASVEDDHGEEIEVFIMRDLFPKIRHVMDVIDTRFTEFNS